MQGFGAKVDARLKALEQKYGMCERMFVLKGAETKLLMGQIEELERRIEALEAKRGPGRPPKAPNGE